MTTVRSYSHALSIEEALEELKRCANTQFDPNLVEIFHNVIQSTKKTPVGMKSKKGASSKAGSVDN